jgi:hypothetical protein
MNRASQGLEIAMSSFSPQEMEAHLHAQRELLVALAAVVAGMMPDSERFFAALDQAAPLQNHQEDPGAIASAAFAVAGATALEYGSLVDAARRRHDAAGRRSAL